MADRHDESIDRALAALRSAAPPEGIEARIIQRMHSSEASPRAFRWRDLLTGSALAGAWWSGALTGAAFAAVAVAAALAVHHGRAAAPPSQQMASTQSQPVKPQLASTHPASEPQPRCAPQEILRVYASPPPAETAPASTPRTRSAPELALTDQERALLRLAHSANAAQLVSMNPENVAKVEAREEADFKEFFAPPPEPDIPTAPESTPDSNDKKGTL